MLPSLDTGIHSSSRDLCSESNVATNPPHVPHTCHKNKISVNLKNPTRLDKYLDVRRGSKDYPLGAKFGQFVHIGSTVKSLSELSVCSVAGCFECVELVESTEIEAALSADIPWNVRKLESVDR